MAGYNNWKYKQVFSDDELKKETWLPIAIYGCRYSISNLGRVKRNLIIDARQKWGGNKTLQPMLITPFTNYTEYFVFRIRKDNITKYHLAHRLVAQSFLPNPENKREVNHIDGNRRNNKVENLEWCTRLENMQHAANTGLMDHVRGEGHPKSKLQLRQVRFIRMVKKISNTNLAALFNVNPNTIRAIRENKSWKNIF